MLTSGSRNLLKGRVYPLTARTSLVHNLPFRYGIMEKNLQELGDSYNTYRLSTNETLREAMGLKSYTTTVLEGKHDRSMLSDVWSNLFDSE